MAESVGRLARRRVATAGQGSADGPGRWYWPLSAPPSRPFPAHVRCLNARHLNPNVYAIRDTTKAVGDMTGRVNALSADQFAAMWNGAGTLDEAADRVRAVVGRPTPRWAVLARAVALRAAGVALKPLPGEPGLVPLTRPDRPSAG